MHDLVARAFTSAGIPSSNEPHALVRSYGKRPDGLTLVPWKGGKPLAWDVTAVCTVADSYVAASVREYVFYGFFRFQKKKHDFLRFFEMTYQKVVKSL